MPDRAPDAYAAAFDARCAASGSPATRRVERPGVRGLVAVESQGRTELLVLDDRAVDVLADLLPRASAGTIRVYDAASRCAQLVRRDGTWKAKAVAAMVCPDLRALPACVLPDGLTLRAVSRSEAQPSEGVPLTDAVAAAGRATSIDWASTAALVAYLRALPGEPRLFAAVDDDGVVRGTSGSRTFSSDAYVFFVNTDPDWRRRGVGLAMTTVALRAAAESGATRASLDASGPGIPLYRRLGFEEHGRLTQFSRSG